MRNATSFLLFGASSLVLTVMTCGGGDTGSRDDAKGGSTATTAGTNSGAGTNSTTAGNSSGGSGGSGGGAACMPVLGSKSGDGTTLVIDDVDDTDTMFAPAGTGSGAWDFSKDTAKDGTITPDGTAALVPEAGGQMGSALHIQGSGLVGWGAALGAFLNGANASFDASSYGGVAFYVKGTSTVQEGADKVMVQARMPDVIPSVPGSCCDDKVVGKECYSGHRIVIGLTAEWQEVRLTWADFKGPAWGLGSTMALEPNRIRDITFAFNNDPAVAGDGASFDVWIDGVRFMTKEEKSNAKPVGSGGSGGGGGGGGAGGGGGSGGSTAEGGSEQ